MIEQPQQMEFGNLLFPGRSSLYVGEVAERLGVDDQHVRNLIDEGRLGAVNVGTGERKFWRIPVAAYERFLKERSSLETAVGVKTPKNLAT